MRWSRFVAALLAAGVVAGPVPAPAAQGVRIYKIYFDSPGSDTGSNSSLNAEYVELKNTGSSSVRLSGWTIRDRADHVYRFGTFTLRAGKRVKVHTGSGQKDSDDVFWGSGWYIWNNNGDKAWLKNSGGSTVDTCEYGGSGSSVMC